jgi:hypothetical protein
MLAALGTAPSARKPHEGPDRGVLRAVVPPRLLRMTEFGLQNIADEASGWWRQVHREMEAFVSAHLPAGAVVREMRLDRRRLEVVVEYDLARRPRAG